MAVRPSILVVDDDPAVLLTYTMILGQHGYEVAGAATAHAARETLSQRHFDLLVCDLALESSRGGLDVLDFARELCPGLPAILLTGFASGEVAEQARQKDVVVLFKPLDVRDLLDVVARLLSPDQRLRAENG